MATLPTDLDRAARTPLATQIYRAVRDAIETGRLDPGAKLPSWRDMAARADALGVGGAVAWMLAEHAVQRVAADDVAATLAEIATGQPKNAVVELAGPEASSMAEFIQAFLSSKGDGRKVIPDPDAKYFGAVLDKDGLAPSGQFIAGPHALPIGRAPDAEPLIKRRSP